MQPTEFATDKAIGFLKSKGILLAAGAAGAGGVALGAGYSKSHPDDGHPLMARATGAGILAAGAGAGLYASRNLLWKGAKKGAEGLVGHVGGAVSAAGRETGFARTFFGHPTVSAGLGMGAGAFIGSQISDDPTEGGLIGGAIGTAAGLAATGGLKIGSLWKKTPKPVRALGFVAAAAAGGVALRAFAHEESPSSEDHAVSDGMGGYESASGVRERARSMNATGDLVFGLNARRH